MGKSFSKEKEWIENGYLCIVVINGDHGFRCGYVGVDMEHPAYGKSYDEMCDIEVHGGLTYAGDHQFMKTEGIWWFGFDCMHSGDSFDFDLMNDPRNRVVYSQLNSDIMRDGEVRTLEFCVNECNSIVKQLEEIRYKESA